MMKRKKAVEYFDREWKLMKKRLRSYFKNGDAEDLHQFRVQVKKVRAFLTLIDSARHQHQFASRMAPVKRIFSRAGEIRNAQVNQALTHQRQSIDKAQQRFVSHQRAYRAMIKKARRVVKGKIRGIKPAFIQRFYEHRLLEVANILATLPSDEQLHNCRKKIKVLLYNEQLAGDALTIKPNATYLDEVQEAIGNWHDQLVTIAHLDQNPAGMARSEELCRRHLAAIEKLTTGFYQRATVGRLEG